MAFSVTPENIPLSWKRTLAGRPASSIHFVLAILFNGICLLALAKTLRILTAMRKTDPGLLIFFAFVLFFLVLAALLVWQVYRKASAEIRVRENSLVLVISYIAFRLYICVLGVAIMLLGIIGLIR
jgi:hypothetical protein